ncbi:hypothetical protein ACIQNU_29795 [Streptomyces sp. NPDC091292]|uniref:hypothetical protein n=1 Tax=Streptomyces sp. NPDC091292 TaxID=3365991 RepID=UPI003822584E
MTDGVRGGNRGRDGVALLGIVFGVVVVVGGVVVVVGGWKAVARGVAPVLLEVPGGGWAVGALCGLVTLGGAVAGWRVQGEGFAGRVVRGLGWGLGFAAFLFVLGSLPGKNCPSYREGCAYIPGSGTALLAYVLMLAVLGGAAVLVRGRRAQAASLAERERIRRLRKKGKGRSRTARNR